MNLTINAVLPANNKVSYLNLQLDNSLKLKNNSNLAFCLSPLNSIFCSIVSINPPIVKLSTNLTTFSTASLSITLGLILSPTIYSNYSSSILTSYDISNFAISRNSTLILFKPSCSLPCK